MRSTRTSSNLSPLRTRSAIVVRYDQALAAYQQIREQNPKLTSVTFVVAGLYRKQAASETDPAARRALLDRAIDTYNAVAERRRAHRASEGRARIDAL